MILKISMQHVFNKEFLFIWKLNFSKELVFHKGNSRKVVHDFQSIGWMYVCMLLDNYSPEIQTTHKILIFRNEKIKTFPFSEKIWWSKAWWRWFDTPLIASYITENQILT